ncbi:MAG: hypothetical protein K6G22_13975 [Lachnospiraceae bacterium]|nr:hypothetical protein [Lachnospiraceae bacterium]
MDKETMEKPEIIKTGIINASEKLWPFIFVIDTSETMQGETIAAINKCMREFFICLREMQKEKLYILYSIGILQINNEAKWITDSLVPIFELLWDDFDAGQTAMYGKALDSLNEKMSRHALFSAGSKIREPVLLFFVGGKSNDDYEGPLARLKTNGWFQHSHRVVISMPGADEKLGRSVVNNVDDIFRIDSINELDGLAETLLRYLTDLDIAPSRIDRDYEEDEAFRQEYQETYSDDDLFGDFDFDDLPFL